MPQQCNRRNPTKHTKQLRNQNRRTTITNTNKHQPKQNQTTTHSITNGHPQRPSRLRQNQGANRMNITIDSREKHRINHAKNYYETQGHEVSVQELPTGDYVFDDQVVMEFKTWSDFMSSITDGRLWNESQKQMENFKIHFVVLHGTNRDYQEALQYVGIEDKHIDGAIARLLTYTKIIRGTGTLTETFELMRLTAEKCLDNKTICKQFDTKSVNYAFNVLAYTVDDIKGERAKTIVNHLKLKTIQDVCNLTYEQLISVPGIGDILANKILTAIGKEQ